MLVVETLVSDIVLLVSRYPAIIQFTILHADLPLSCNNYLTLAEYIFGFSIRRNKIVLRAYIRLTLRHVQSIRLMSNLVPIPIQSNLTYTVRPCIV